MRVGDIAGAIQETMESYEVEINGKFIPGVCARVVDLLRVPYPLCGIAVKPIENLSGHSINPYQIHGGKSILLVKNNDQTKMEEGEYFAIETFGSTGTGRVVEEGECSHYARVLTPPNVPLRQVSTNTGKTSVLTCPYTDSQLPNHC